MYAISGSRMGAEWGKEPTKTNNTNTKGNQEQKKKNVPNKESAVDGPPANEIERTKKKVWRGQH